MPKVSSYSTLLHSQFEDTNVIFLTWAATIYLVVAIFDTDKNHNGALESLTIYVSLMFACLLSALCDWIKEQ